MGTVLRWNGSGWSPSISGTDRTILDLWAAPTGEVFATTDGAGILAHAP